MGRREYPKHKGDAVDRYLTALCQPGPTIDALTRLCDELGHPEWLPLDGTVGSKRMAVGHAIRRAFPDNILVFASGSIVNLEVH